ncbi:hypothetical protein OTU49_014850 [Cherax quadricarinatus]|uniref:Protein kinase domain-containing protein n=1 Tax=Cherax quadricarinatus TaxID=27406 RepID=A0AAW0YRG3_CHEQU
MGLCTRILASETDIVIKTFTGSEPYEDLFTELKYLHRVQGVTGVQKLVGVALKLPLLITEFDGISLYKYCCKDIEKNKFFIILKNICRTVKELNMLGIIHNDIKSDNICVKESHGEPKTSLIDFGNSTEKGDILFKRRLSKHAKETLDWIAPEVQESKVSTPESDAYSVAVMTEELTKNLNMSLPREMQNWIKKCQEKNPAKRPDMDDLINIIDSKQRKRSRTEYDTEEEQQQQPPQKRTKSYCTLI